MVTTTGNNSSAPDGHPDVRTTEIVVYVFVLLTESTLSILGSLLVCVTFTCVRTLSSKPTSKLIVNLAASDAAMGALVLPFTAATVINQRWVYGDAMCKVQGFLKTFLSQVQRSTLVLIAVDRLLRIRYRYSFGTRRPNIMLWPIIATWLLNALLAAPPLIGWGEIVWHPTKPSCTVDWLVNKSYSVTFLVVFGFSLQIVITMCYVLIFTEVWSSRRRVQQLAILSLQGDQPGPTAADRSASPAVHRPHPPANPLLSREEVALARTMIILVTLSTVLSLPYIISNLISLLTDSYLSYHNEMVVILLVYLNSCLNPVIYGATNSRFRRAFRTVIRCSCRQQR